MKEYEKSKEYGKAKILTFVKPIIFEIDKDITRNKILESIDLLSDKSFWTL